MTAKDTRKNIGTKEQDMVYHILNTVFPLSFFGNDNKVSSVRPPVQFLLLPLPPTALLALCVGAECQVD